ncbi:hypothetical protein VitviT2T_005356 [Vitis vinifera]|uniref:Uncharacterized protein n=1 Tax=Vitis vinifera TaxID=29760 RepID=A0ABY9BTK7_VITVI|nr:hypothetical protein VitviT2T_005356 [Vitis vinifera]
MFTAPLSNDLVVAIIRGGKVGLSCALYLVKIGVQSTVFNPKIHGLRGRMRTRMIDPQPLIFDHKTQFFIVSDPRFAKLVDGWLEKSLVQQWQSMIGELVSRLHINSLKIYNTLDLKRTS